MLRRSLSIALILGYLASQLAAVPHAHGGSSENQSSGHNVRPHIHISSFNLFDHSHDRHSDDGHAHHHECDDSHSHSASSSSNAEHDDHDNDAVYLPNDTGFSLPSKSVVSLDCLQSVSTLAIAAIATPAARSEPSAVAYSPGECSLGCPLYLALRALRI
jgi:hypothetical protein